MKMTAVMLFGFFLAARPSVCQHGGVTSDTARLLASENWHLRADAMQRLAVKDTPETRQVLVDLLSREDAYSAKAIRELGGTDARFGEEYGDYISDLMDVVQRFADEPGYRRALPALARGIYDPQSKFAAWLAHHGEVLLPTLTQMSQSLVWSDRDNAVGVMAEMLHQAKTGDIKLTASNQASLEKAVIAATADKFPPVKYEAIDGLAKVGGREAERALSVVAQQDKTYSAEEKRYPMRDHAREVLAKMSVQE